MKTFQGKHMALWFFSFWRWSNLCRHFGQKTPIWTTFTWSLRFLAKLHTVVHWVQQCFSLWWTWACRTRSDLNLNLDLHFFTWQKYLLSSECVFWCRASDEGNTNLASHLSHCNFLLLWVWKHRTCLDLFLALMNFLPQMWHLYQMWYWWKWSDRAFMPLNSLLHLSQLCSYRPCRSLFLCLFHMPVPLHDPLLSWQGS